MRRLQDPPKPWMKWPCRKDPSACRGIGVGGTVLLGRVFTAVLVAGMSLPGFAAFKPSRVAPPAPVREYRAAWIATVSNIDWPSTNSLSTAQQKAELLAIIDRAAALKLNALIFQVRPGCDALYASKIEPWSEYLTGQMGRAPKPLWDPLAFAVAECHKRGMELHAWFNPYRARHPSATGPVVAGHISQTRPQLVKKYGGHLWLDPGEKAVQDYSLSVVMDVLRRYDIDGAHFDDYFYPYRERGSGGKELGFPDDASWTKTGQKTGMSREDWRRENVNVFVQRVYREIKAAKPWVKFGISPFGIWRPGHPPQIKGLDAYDSLYADARKWLNEGWVDYFAPQLYWAIEPPDQSFPVLLDWWARQNQHQRHLAPGLNTTRAQRQWPPSEIVNQVRIARKPGAHGHVHWNIGSLTRSRPLAEALSREVYDGPALVPAATWLDRSAPPPPRLTVLAQAKAPRATWTPAGADPIAAWLVQERIAGQWRSRVVAGKDRSAPLDRQAQVVAVTAVDRFGNASEPRVLERGN